MYGENSCLRLLFHETERTKQMRKRPRACAEHVAYRVAVRDVNSSGMLAKNRVQLGSKRRKIRQLGPSWDQFVTH